MNMTIMLNLIFLHQILGNVEVRFLTEKIENAVL
jgi:hypothetical protein